MSTSQGDGVSELVGDFLDWLPAPLYVSLLGILIGASGWFVDLAGYPVVSAMVGAYGIIMVGWGLAAWVIILLAIRVDSYRR